jgi:hypothetical protein
MRTRWFATTWKSTKQSSRLSKSTLLWQSRKTSLLTKHLGIPMTALKWCWSTRLITTPSTFSLTIMLIRPSHASSMSEMSSQAKHSPTRSSWTCTSWRCTPTEQSSRTTTSSNWSSSAKPREMTRFAESKLASLRKSTNQCRRRWTLRPSGRSCKSCPMLSIWWRQCCRFFTKECALLT